MTPGLLVRWVVLITAPIAACLILATPIYTHLAH